MNDVLIYNEYLQEHAEINLFEEDSLNQMCGHIYRRESNNEEMKGDYQNQLNKTKSGYSNQANELQKKVSEDLDIYKQIFTQKMEEEEIKNDEMNNDLLYLTYNKKEDNFNFNKKKRNRNNNLVLFMDHKDNGCKKFISNKNNNNKNVIFKNQIINDKNEDISSQSYEKKTELSENCDFQVKEKIIDKNNLNNIKDDKKKPKLMLSKRGPYKKGRLDYKTINFNDKCFPFKTGKGVINITTKFNYNSNEQPVISDNIDSTFHETLDNKSDKTMEESSNYNLNLNDKASTSTFSNSENDIYLMKFVTKKYYYSENGRRKRVKKKRKYKADIIRKKIKSRFHKTIKNKINEYLKKAGSKMLFDCLPQCFIGNITKLLNSKCFNFTYEDLIKTDFSSELNNYRHTTMDNTKYIKNLKVLAYLENNPEISKNSGFDIIKNMKYIDILNRYFLSTEFEDSLNQLKDENETQEYIQSYIYTAKNYVNFYSYFCFYKNINFIFEEKEDEPEEEINFDKDQIYYLFKDEI